jgi:ribosome-associated toxin RatA of RatAB toxin-antitoxin module
MGGSFSWVFTAQVYRFAAACARASLDVREYRGKRFRRGGSKLQVVERSAIVTFTTAQMFALVNDVGRYPEFLPWCTGAHVEDTSDTERLASIKVSRGVLRTAFTTRNTLKKDTQILMHLVDGPFRSLVGEWRFDAIGERGSRVTFRVEFEFKNRLTAVALSAAFEALCSTIVDAFAVRAQKIYADGKRPG